MLLNMQQNKVIGKLSSYPTQRERERERGGGEEGGEGREMWREQAEWERLRQKTNKSDDICCM